MEKRDHNEISRSDSSSPTAAESCDLQSVLNWMYEQLPMYHRVGQAAYKANLDNTLLLDAHLGSPHRRFRTIHVGGTNGKGSVSHMLASVLQEAGYKTGLYTSPHLKDFRERIKINGEMIPEEYVVRFIKKHHDFFTSIHPSFFEMTVAMAFQYFADQEVDIAVIEVGLGGRLDSTNIISPLVSVITNISWDHTALLGDTLEKIAAEKAGIIKPGIPVVIGSRDKHSAPVFEEKAQSSHSPLSFASEVWSIEPATDSLYTIQRNKQTPQNTPDNPGTNSLRSATYTLQPDLRGHYQRKNIPTVLEALLVLREAGLTIPDDAIGSGIERTVANTGLYGRWQILSKEPLTVCDTAHNVDGVTEVMRQIKETPCRKLHIVWGMVNDKDIDHVLDLLPRDACYYFTKASIPRALDETILATQAEAKGLYGNTYPGVPEALQAARLAAHPEDMIYIGGSTFIVAEI